MCRDFETPRGHVTVCRTCGKETDQPVRGRQCRPCYNAYMSAYRAHRRLTDPAYREQDLERCRRRKENPLWLEGRREYARAYRARKKLERTMGRSTLEP